MLERFDSLIIRLSASAILPVAFFRAGWWGGIPLLPEKYVWISALGGSACGVILSVVLAARFIRLPDEFHTPLAIVVYLFYSFCVFGFFMGVPVFCLLLAPPAGIYVGRRMKHRGADLFVFRKTALPASLFTAATTLMVCIVSAFVALVDPHTPTNLQELLKVSFEITRSVLLAVIVVGGAALVFLHFWLTRFAANVAYRR